MPPQIPPAQPAQPAAPSTLDARLTALEVKMDAVLKSVEKTRRYTFWSLMIPLAFFILPLLAIPLVIPLFQTYLSTLSLPANY